MNHFALKPNEALSGIVERYIAAVAAKRDDLTAGSTTTMTDEADVAKDLPAAMRSAYRPAFPMPRLVEQAEFEGRARKAREAAPAQAG